MISAFNRLLAPLGMAMPVNFDGVQATFAALLALLAFILGWLIARRSAPVVERLVQTHLVHQDAARPRRIVRVVRFTSIALLLWIAFDAWAWDPVAAVILGLSLASAAMLAVNGVTRFLAMPRWAGLILSLVIFGAVVGRLLGGLGPVLNALDSIGITVGHTHVSLLSVVRMLVTAIVLYALVRLVNRLVHHGMMGTGRLDPAQKLLAEKLIGIVVVAVAVLVGIDILGIDLTAFTVFSGAFGLAVGFGLQKTLGNLIAGIILLMDRSIKPGDVIVVGDSFGWVNKIGIRAVSVLTRDGKEHLIPNEHLMTNEVENWSYSSRNVRVRIPVGVAYDSDMDRAEALMRQAAAESPRVLDTPAPNVWMTGYGDNAVTFEILAWISDPEEGVGNVRSDVLKRLWRLFKAEGIEVPFPQRDIRVRQIITSGPDVGPQR